MSSSDDDDATSAIRKRSGNRSNRRAVVSDDEDEEGPPKPSLNAITLSVTDHLVGRRAALSLGTDHNPLTPQQLRAYIERPLKLVEAAVWFASQRSQGKRRREEPPLPVGYVIAEYSPATRVRVMFGCATAACQRLSTSLGEVFVPSWAPESRSARRCAELMMERVTRGYVRKVEVRWQRRACCDVNRASVRFLCMITQPVCLTRAAANAG